MTQPLHRARLEDWTRQELLQLLEKIVDGLNARGRKASPLQVALELLGGELEAFLLFARVGHLDPPREDGDVPIAILQRKSADPEVDAAILKIVRLHLEEQSGS